MPLTGATCRARAVAKTGRGSTADEPQAVDEVMQDVALAAVAQRSPLVNPARAAVWLYRLAVRQVLMYRRRLGRQRSLVNRYAIHNVPNETDSCPTPLAWLLSDERQRIVPAALRRLPSRDAELLVLKYTEGYGARELAVRIGATVPVIEARLHRPPTAPDSAGRDDGRIRGE